MFAGSRREAWRGTLRCCLVVLLVGAGCCSAAEGDTNPASAPLEIGRGFDIQLPVDAPVVFRGGASLDAAGGPKAQILYPAVGGLAGLLVGITTHGALIEADKAREKSRIQKEADTVIDPYRDAIHDFTFRKLAEHALQKGSVKGLGRLIDTTETGDGFVMKSAPVFFLTADRRALILENTVAIHQPGISEKSLYLNTFRVVSDSRNVEGLEPYWGNDGARELKRVSQALFARSLEMAVATLEDPGRAVSGAEKTIRFYEGSARQIERGRILDQACDRLLVVNLRGWVMSVPAQTTSKDATCEAFAL